MKKNIVLPVLLFIFYLALTSFCLIKPVFAEEKPQTSKIKLDNQEISDRQARWELARVLSYAKKYDESIVEYKKLLKVNPDLYQAKIEMANIMFWQGERKEALAILEQVPMRNIDENTKIVMADIYVAQKEYKKSEPLYRGYLERNPGDQKVRFKLAQMLSWDKRYNDSISEYKIILNIIPDDIQIRRKFAYVLIWAGRHKEAIEELRKTLK
jgi:tetratricopeptide (TPR) repeat protein